MATRRKKINRKKVDFAISNPKNKQKDLRFSLSLVILMGILIVSMYFLLISLNGSLSRKIGSLSSSVLPIQKNSTTAKKSDCSLNDPSVDFGLSIPSQLGEWMYKTGYVKSPTDDTLSNHYVQLLVPVETKNASNNFEDRNMNILTIRKFSQSEWSKLEKGCQKGNQFFCETAGKMVAENNGSVYAYTKPGNCQKNLEAKCRLTDNIIQSFKLK